ncbi:MAG: D-alanyl-D-alanine carboxypeptidase, partial [Cyanobacteriota bacterium]|nr:D-alanyl-D-alanine carboxypeptidase [Cyanobacteriota bacterium]
MRRSLGPLLLPLTLASGPVIAAGGSHPALPTPGLAVAQTPLVSLPGAPPPIGLPLLQSQVSCPALQQRIAALAGGEASVWSITVADPSGRLLADLNGLVPRIPASNQKLISTAYALDQLGPDYRLRSQLWRLGDGSFRLTGEGDPDLALPQLQRFAKLALGSGGGSGSAGTVVRLQIAEEPQQSWWPAGWSPDDRYTAYGAPITRLAVTSNAIHEAVMNPPSRLQTLLQRTAAQQGGRVQVSLVSSRQPLP